MNSSWSSKTRYTILAAILLLVAWFLYEIRPLISPLIIASLFAYMLYPLVKQLETWSRRSYALSVNLVYFPSLLLLVALPSIFIPLLVREIETLTSELSLVIMQAEEFLARSVTILGITFSPGELADFLNLNNESLTPAAGATIHALEATSTSLLWALVILVSIYYLLMDWQGLRDWFVGIAPESEQADILRLLQEINQVWRAYLRGTMNLMFIMGVFFIIVGLAIGLPGAVALGLLTGLLSIIPELGPFIAGVIASLVALVEGSNFLPMSNFWFAALVATIYIVAMHIKALWLRPIIMGRFLHMNTGLVFVVIIGAALISGILAALIVLPVLVMMGQIGRYVRCKLLGIPVWPEETAVSTTATITSTQDMA